MRLTRYIQNEYQDPYSISKGKKNSKEEKKISKNQINYEVFKK